MAETNPIAKAAPKIASAQPKTSAAVLSFIKMTVLPILAPALAGIIKKYGKGKLEKYLIPARDILNEAYPVEPEEARLIP